MGRLVLFLILMFSVTLIFAQSEESGFADELEALLFNDAVTYAEAARFILQALEADTDDAFSYAAEKGWLPKKAAAEDEARLDGIALLLMKAFDFKGGLFYAMTKNTGAAAHYAYRELEYKKYIQADSYPSMKVPGSLLIYMTSNAMQ